MSWIINIIKIKQNILNIWFMQEVGNYNPDYIKKLGFYISLNKKIIEKFDL
jgi:hypothetical protein